MTAPSFPELADTLGTLLRRPYRRLQGRLYERLAAEGFSEVRSAHSAVFRHLQPGGSRLTDLAAAADLTKQSMAYLIEHLAGAGYLRVRPDPADRRARLVLLTARGRRCVEAALRISRELEAEAAHRLGAARLGELRRSLQELDAALAGAETGSCYHNTAKPTPGS